MINRIMGVLKLDVPTFEEIEHDEGATSQAAIIVLIVAIIAAIGAGVAVNAIGGVLEGLEGAEGLEGLGNLPGIGGGMSPMGSAINAFIGTFISWGLWSYVTYFVGTRMFDGKATPQEMLRVIGFSMAPRVLSIIPCLGFIGWIWALVAGFVGIRQGLDLDNGKTALTVIISIVAVIAVNFVIGLILTPIFLLTG